MGKEIITFRDIKIGKLKFEYYYLTRFPVVGKIINTFLVT